MYETYLFTRRQRENTTKENRIGTQGFTLDEESKPVTPADDGIKAYLVMPWTSHVRWIEPDVNNPDYVFAAIEAGALVQSHDGGLTWIESSAWEERDHLLPHLLPQSLLQSLTLALV